MKLIKGKVKSEVTGSISSLAEAAALAGKEGVVLGMNNGGVMAVPRAAYADAQQGGTILEVAAGGWNGASVDRLRSALGNSGSLNTGVLAAVPHLWSATNTFTSLRSALGAGDANDGSVIGSAHGYGYNGVSWDRQRNNTEATAISSAARTATAESAVLTNHNGRGIQVAVHASAKAAATTLRVDLLVRDSVSGVYAIKASSTAFAAVAGTTYMVDFAPGVLDADYAAGGDGRNVLVPRTYKVQVTPGDASEVTYGASVSTI